MKSPEEQRIYNARKMRAWRKANPERTKEIKRKSDLKNKETKLAGDRRRGKRYREQHPEKVKAKYIRALAEDDLMLRKQSLKARYGITIEEWDAMFEAQGRRCACCGDTEPRSSKGWNTDHEHKTGKVRGVVCHPCNSRIGHLESPLVPITLAYLAKHGGAAQAA